MTDNKKNWGLNDYIMLFAMIAFLSLTISGNVEAYDIDLDDDALIYMPFTYMAVIVCLAIAAYIGRIEDEQRKGN